MVTFSIMQMDQRSFNSTFPGNGDHGALSPLQNNITKYCFFILHVSGSLSSGNNPGMLNLSLKLGFFGSIFRCARLGAISLDGLDCDQKSEHQ
jgi:hypothetical protein